MIGPLHRGLCKGGLAGCAARRRGARGKARRPSPPVHPLSRRPADSRAGQRTAPSSVGAPPPFPAQSKGGNGPAATGALPLLYHAGRQIPMPPPKLPPFDKKAAPATESWSGPAKQRKSRSIGRDSCPKRRAARPAPPGRRGGPGSFPRGRCPQSPGRRQIQSAGRGWGGTRSCRG